MIATVLLLLLLLQAEMLSGNVTIETNFFDGQRLLAKSLIRVYYD